MARRVLSGNDYLMTSLLDNPASGHVGFGAKTDGFYQKIGGTERRLLTSADLTTLVTTNTSQTIGSSKIFSSDTTFNSTVNLRGGLLDMSITAPLYSSRRQGLYIYNNSSYFNLYANGRSGTEILKLTHTSTQKYFHLPDSDMKVRFGRYGDYLTQHQLVVAGSVLFEDDLTVNGIYRFGSSGWTMEYSSSGVQIKQNGVIKFQVTTLGAGRT